MNFKWAILITGVLFSCGNNNRNNSSPSLCELLQYELIHPGHRSYTEWKISYMEYIVNCPENSEQVKKMAQIEAEVLGEYTFILYGMIESMEVYERIYQTYPIGFHTAGCDSQEMGEIYNDEMKRYLMENEGLDYDSIMHKAFEE